MNPLPPQMPSSSMELTYSHIPHLYQTVTKDYRDEPTRMNREQQLIRSAEIRCRCNSHQLRSCKLGLTTPSGERPEQEHEKKSLKTQEADTKNTCTLDTSWVFMKSNKWICVNTLSHKVEQLSSSCLHIMNSTAVLFNNNLFLFGNKITYMFIVHLSTDTNHGITFYMKQIN